MLITALYTIRALNALVCQSIVNQTFQFPTEKQQKGAKIMLLKKYKGEFGVNTLLLITFAKVLAPNFN